MRIKWSLFGMYREDVPEALFTELLSIYPKGLQTVKMPAPIKPFLAGGPFYPQEVEKECFAGDFQENDPILVRLLAVLHRHGIKPTPLQRWPGQLMNGQEYKKSNAEYELWATRQYDDSDYSSAEFLSISVKPSLSYNVDGVLHKGLIAVPKRCLPKKCDSCMALFGGHPFFIGDPVRRALLSSQLTGCIIHPVLEKAGSSYSLSSTIWELAAEAIFPENDKKFRESINIFSNEIHYKRSSIQRVRNHDVAIEYGYHEDPLSRRIVVSGRFYRFWRDSGFGVCVRQQDRAGLEFKPLRIDNDLSPEELERLSQDAIPAFTTKDESEILVKGVNLVSPVASHRKKKPKLVRKPLKSLSRVPSLKCLLPNSRQIVLPQQGAGVVLRPFDIDSVTGAANEFPPASGVGLMDVSNDLRYLIIAYNDTCIHVYNLFENREMKEFPKLRGPIRTLAICPDGAAFVYSGYNKKIFAYCFSDAHATRELEGHDDYLASLVFSPDGQKLISSSHDRTIRIWDFKSGVCERTIETHRQANSEGLNYVKALAVTLDNKRIISGASDGAVAVWDIASGKQLHYLIGHTYAPDFEGDNVYDENYQSSYDDDEREQGVNAVAVTPDGKRIVSGGDDRTVRLWDIETGSQLRIYFGHKSGVESIAIPPDGKRILSLSSDGVLNIWAL